MCSFIIGLSTIEDDDSFDVLLIRTYQRVLEEHTHTFTEELSSEHSQPLTSSTNVAINIGQSLFRYSIEVLPMIGHTHTHTGYVSRAAPISQRRDKQGSPIIYLLAFTSSSLPEAFWRQTCVSCCSVVVMAEAFSAASDHTLDLYHPWRERERVSGERERER